MKGFNRRTNLCIYFCPSSRGLIMGVWNSHTSVGNILGSVIAGSFVMTNWGLSFIVPGLIIITGGGICFFFLLPSKYHIFLKQFIFQSGRISNSKSGLPHHPGETVGRKCNLLYVLYTKGSIIII